MTQDEIKQLIRDHPLVARLINLDNETWINPQVESTAKGLANVDLGMDDVLWKPRRDYSGLRPISSWSFRTRRRPAAWYRPRRWHVIWIQHANRVRSAHPPDTTTGQPGGH